MEASIQDFGAVGRIYPYLGEYKKDEVNKVVLFTDESTGVCLYSNNDYEMGKISHDWNEHRFTVFNGSITIKN